jgi:uncharacterized membrane protein YkvA (DUF1232 family)
MTNRKSPWSLKREIFTLFYAFRDDQTPVLAKFTTLLSLLYLISPVDIIPDVIPFAGYLDDLIVVPVLLHVSNLLLPDAVKQRSMIRVVKHRKRLNGILIVIVASFLAIISLSIYFLFYHNR